uniref:Uncharacterized protein n=1 Tax=Ditylenchus dipsaci TaxID=166011 RepID=A0A915DKU8_9BILA
MLMERGEPRLHPLTIDGQICSFARFHNVNCPNGFLYLTSSDRMMRISLLRSDVVYDVSYPVRKIPIPNTVQFVVYLLQCNLYGVVTSVRAPNNKLCTLLNEDKQIETCERDENFALPELDRYTLQLFSPEDWSLFRILL